MVANGNNKYFSGGKGGTGVQRNRRQTLKPTSASLLIMGRVPLATVKEVIGHRPAIRHEHPASQHIQAVMEKGSLNQLGLGTGSRTGNNCLK